MMNYGEMEVRPTVVLTKDIIKKFMPKFKRHDDLIIIQESAWEEFKKSLPIPVAIEENSPFSIDQDELASLVCQTIQKPICRRLAIEKGIKNDNYRTPNVELILGDTGIVNHKENHIQYRFDITKCMFSFGNINEKMRMGELDCSEEIVVDLFAGIGYFSLPLLIHAKAKHLYACEWNPDAIEALKKNLQLNKIDQSRCTVLEGDNRTNRPTDVAQRVILGILPSCFDWMRTAFECIDKSTGAILHCHDLIELKPQATSINTNSSSELEAITTTTVTTITTSSSSTTIPTNDKLNTLIVAATATTTSSGNNNNNQINLLSNQSVSSTSSASSHSTLEKIIGPLLDEKTISSESDKTNSSSPVFLEKPSDTSCTNSSSAPPSPTQLAQHVNNIENSNTSAGHNDTSSSGSLYFETDNMNEICPRISDTDLGVYETRAQTLIDRIRDDVDAHDLKARMLQFKIIKSYAPHINHVVIDIKIEPKSNRFENIPKFPLLDHLTYER